MTYYTLHLLLRRVSPFGLTSRNLQRDFCNYMPAFSSEDGRTLVRWLLRDLWPYTPRDYQLEAVTKALDGIDVLTVLPTGAGKTAILIMFMLVLDYMKNNTEEFKNHTRFPPDPIMIVVYPTNCLEEEQVRMYKISDSNPGH